MLDLEKLHDFILAAKATTYVGDGQSAPSSRPASHDLAYQAGDFQYLDSYFGGSDFIGQEIVFYLGSPVWGMNYYGVLREPEVITAAEVGKMIKDSLSLMYHEGRFLGGWQHSQGELTYHDMSQGDLTHFSGREWIEKDGRGLYQLVYHGGMIK